MATRNTSRQQPARRPAATRQTQTNRRRRFPVSAVFGAFAAGAGAAAMYYLDPEAGYRRRQQLAATATQAAHTGSDMAGRAWGNLSTRAGEISHQLSDRAAGLNDSAASIGQDVSERAQQLGGQLMSQARGMFGSRPRSYQIIRHYALPAAGISASAIGCIALGALLMYAFDPERGAERRAMARERAVDFGQTFRRTGKRWSTILGGDRGTQDTDAGGGHRTDFTGFVPNQPS